MKEYKNLDKEETKGAADDWIHNRNLLNEKYSINNQPKTVNFKEKLQFIRFKIDSEIES